MQSVFIEALGGTRLYPITDRALSKLSFAEQVSLLCQGGAKVVQLRDKTLSPQEFYPEAAAALTIARECEVKIIINDRVDIALALGADGVHLGQDDLGANAARELLGARAIVGLSTHNLEQARAASKLPVDYVALGPIFETSTKRDPDPTVGLEGLKLVKAILDQTPLVAIGGITNENGRLALENGADALAVIGEIWGTDTSHFQKITDLVTTFTTTKP